MKKYSLIALSVILLIFSASVAFALTGSEAKQAWEGAKARSRELQALHRDAKIAYAADRTPENNTAVVDTGKDVLNAALDEVEAWLNWKEIEANESTEISDSLKEEISSDVQKNLATIADLRTDVNGIDSQLDLGLVFLKMVGKYVELITDVARNCGKVVVHLAGKYLDTAESYEVSLRAAAEQMPDNSAIIAELDSAKSSLDEARSNVSKAEASYLRVVLPGTPLIKFAEGNNYIRTARTNLLSAHASLNRAYALIYAAGD